MHFLVYQNLKDPENFLITDFPHRDKARAALADSGEEVMVVGSFEEIGESRAAFDESIAKAAIEKQGYYRIHAESLADVPITPEMPG